VRTPLAPASSHVRHCMHSLSRRWHVLLHGVGDAAGAAVPLVHPSPDQGRLTTHPPCRFVWIQPGSEAHVGGYLADRGIHMDEPVDPVSLPADPAFP
jgi:hypothetical protein